MEATSLYSHEVGQIEISGADVNLVTQTGIEPVIRHIFSLERREWLVNYESLTSPQDIRIVVLHKGYGRESIHCKMIHHDIRSASYEALSYEWGQLSPDDPRIRLNGRHVGVRKNLWEALCHLRDHEIDRYIWVDALCIDQRNVDERSRQVAMMGQIYQRASQVVVWLGTADKQSRLVKKTFCTILAANKASRDKAFPGSPNDDHIACLTLKPKARGKLEPGDEATINITLEQVRAITAWAERSYWYRIWIIQEIRLARRLLIHCGDDTISGSDLLDIQAVLQESCHQERNISKFPAEWTKMCIGTKAFSLLPEWGIASDTKLKDWLLRCTTSKYEEPCDYVYALLAVSSDCVVKDGNGHISLSPRSLVPNYSMSVGDLCRATLDFCDATERLCRQSRDDEKAFEPRRRGSVDRLIKQKPNIMKDSDSKGRESSREVLLRKKDDHRNLRERIKRKNGHLEEISDNIDGQRNSSRSRREDDSFDGNMEMNKPSSALSLLLAGTSQRPMLSSAQLDYEIDGLHSSNFELNEVLTQQLKVGYRDVWDILSRPKQKSLKARVGRNRMASIINLESNIENENLKGEISEMDFSGITEISKEFETVVDDHQKEIEESIEESAEKKIAARSLFEETEKSIYFRLSDRTKVSILPVATAKVLQFEHLMPVRLYLVGVFAIAFCLCLWFMIDGQVM